MAAILLFYSTTCLAEEPIVFVENYFCQNFGDSFNEVLFVSVAQQRLYHIKDGVVVKSYIVSTAELGIGNQDGSFKTPIGLHSIRQKIGQGVPLYGRLVGRKFTGEICRVHLDSTRSKTDDITSRIFWLDGEEPNINQGGAVDSYKRHIYIHGTSEEGRLGTPSSHGCIRMSNRAVIELFGKVRVGTKVLILSPETEFSAQKRKSADGSQDDKDILANCY